MAGGALLPVALLVCLALAGGADAARKPVGFYELKNKKGDFSIKVTNWGATLVSVFVPDCKGDVADVILGYDTIAEYVNGTQAFGSTVGRVANRIFKSRFVLDGKAYRLFPNDGNNSIHGGHRGFGKVIWTVKEYVSGGDSPYITFFYHSFDGEQGFPGDLDVYTTYRLSSPYELSISMNATATTKATPVNLANHAYWNLAGHDSGDVLQQELQILASSYTTVDAMIPTGQIEPVAGTIYDFLQPTPVGEHMDIVPGGGGGYDLNFVVNGEQDAFRQVARVEDPKSGRGMEVWANQPGVQLYTSNWVINEKGKNGKVYGQYGALCLETQAYPDAVNHPEFPSSIVRPGQVYKHDMAIKFYQDA
ncbi:galactose mutarotase-like [Lolium rigidum]|uniref:galactose mutarotase-like n=1 Tax=Lolium rigidum TaxID=89674 RepID=UPI001F5D7483|nr:galactose mutarotase-like [Lolium rigidum]